MCVYSMVYDHYNDKWGRWPYRNIEPDYWRQHPWPHPDKLPEPRRPTADEIAEFYKLLERAREYDRKNNQPDCGLEHKKEALQKLADSLGIEIKFPEDDVAQKPGDKV